MSAPYFPGIRRLFGPSLVDNNHEPIPYIWVSMEHIALCVNPNSMRVYAQISHDGYGKFYPTVYVSIYDAIRLKLRDRSLSIRLRSFPRIALQFFRLKRFRMERATEDFERVMMDLGIIPRS